MACKGDALCPSTQKASLAEAYYGPGPGDGVSGDKSDVAPNPSGGAK